MPSVIPEFILMNHDFSSWTGLEASWVLDYIPEFMLMHRDFSAWAA